MHNAAYTHLKKCLDDSVKNPLPSLCVLDAQRVHHAIMDHMDALVSDTSTTASIGHLFVSRFSLECPPLNQPCSSGLQALGRAAFKWAMQEEDWTCAAWLISFSGLCIPLPSPVHPHPCVLYALTCNDSYDWPPVYSASLNNHALVARAIACDNSVITDDEDNLSVQTRKYFSHIRKACYFGPGRGMLAVNIVFRWLALHHDGKHDYDSLPKSMILRHAHPEQNELDRMLQNQWRVQRFWSTGDAKLLDDLAEIEENDFQAWLWVLNAETYKRYGDLSARMPAWDDWWAGHLPNMVSQARFWLNLHVQMQGLNPSALNKNQRLLAVRAALALKCLRPDGLYELPEEYQETSQALALPPLVELLQIV